MDSCQASCYNLYLQRRLSRASLFVFGVLTCLCYALGVTFWRDVTANIYVGRRVNALTIERSPELPMTDFVSFSGSAKPGTWVYYRFLSLPECAPAPESIGSCTNISTLLPQFTRTCATTHTVYIKVGKPPTDTDYDVISCGDNPHKGAVCGNFYIYIGVFIHSTRSGWRPGRNGAIDTNLMNGTYLPAINSLNNAGGGTQAFEETIASYHCAPECNLPCGYHAWPHRQHVARQWAPFMLLFTILSGLWFLVITIALYRLRWGYTYPFLPVSTRPEEEVEMLDESTESAALAQHQGWHPRGRWDPVAFQAVP